MRFKDIKVSFTFTQDNITGGNQAAPSGIDWNTLLDIGENEHTITGM
jgi:hypothetical protein